MIKYIKIFVVIFLLWFSCDSRAVNLPGMSDDDDETLKTYLERVQSGEVENSRDYDGTRKASLNKKPWMSDSLGDMELLEWPDEGQHDYAADDGRTDFRYYESDCMFSAGYYSKLGPVTAQSNNHCYETFYFYHLVWLRPGSIITKAEIDGPAQLAGYSASGGKNIGMFYLESPGGGPSWTLYIFPNASYGSEVELNVFTISDKAYQDQIYLEEANRMSGYHVTEAELREGRKETKEYYSNRGCDARTLIHCMKVCKCLSITPTIDDNDADDVIASAGSVNLWVDSSGLACPPYTWSVSGTGWSLKYNKTYNDLETTTLSLIDTTGKTCGVDFVNASLITVVDACGESAKKVIKGVESWSGSYEDPVWGPARIDNWECNGIIYASASDAQTAANAGLIELQAAHPGYTGSGVVNWSSNINVLCFNWGIFDAYVARVWTNPPGAWYYAKWYAYLQS